MNCPRCNAKVAFMKDRCDNCGQDLKTYRKVISLSNIYYNKGLEQAKVRDLSGAIRSLKQSLEFNKLNTNARNLLGLIYFEEGEIVSALSEWVISKNFQEKNNDADQYMNAIQSTPNKLDSYNQTIKKYNSALYSAQHGDGDMAIIQLKKVVSLNPKFVRAHQLLALLYMMSGKKDQRIRAKRLLTAIQKVDAPKKLLLYKNPLRHRCAMPLSRRSRFGKRTSQSASQTAPLTGEPLAGRASPAVRLGSIGRKAAGLALIGSDCETTLYQRVLGKQS